MYVVQFFDQISAYNSHTKIHMQSSSYSEYTTVHPPLSSKMGQHHFIYFNYFAIAAHFVSFMIMIFLYVAVTNTNVVIPYTETFQKWENLLVDSTCPFGSRSLDTSKGVFCIFSVTQPVSCNDNNECDGIDFGWLVISFHMLSFFFQSFAVATDFTGPIMGYKYSTMVTKSTNPLRFFEYAISASVMLVAIALLNGVTDINLIVSIAILTSACQLCGLVVEYIDDLVLKWVLHLTGWLQFIWAYVIIFSAFFNSIKHSAHGAGPPEFVFVIVVALFVLYGSFGMVQLMELIYILRNKGKLNPYMKEISYIMLSLTAKVLLGWMIFSNVLVLGRT